MFGISTSNDVGISSIYAKKMQEIGTGLKPIIYQRLRFFQRTKTCKTLPKQVNAHQIRYVAPKDVKITKTYKT